MRLFRHIGTVSSQTVWTDDDGHPNGRYDTFHWLLLVGPFGWRRFKLIGRESLMSRAARDKHAAVIAWTKGGPMPELDAESLPPKAAPVLKLVKD